MLSIPSNCLDIIAVVSAGKGASSDLWGALGHNLRRRLLWLLARSDRSVNELVELVDERQNLVSYHLGLLKRSGLVTERRSSADGRDVYYHLNLDHLGSGLNAAATELHPALGGTAGVRPKDRLAPTLPVRVLFICRGNSARSLMAEAITRTQSEGAVQAHSAGTKPAGINPLTLEVLSELGFDTNGLRSKGFDDVIAIHFRHVITLCDIARENFPSLPGRPEYIHWSLADPAAVTGPKRCQKTAFRSTAEEIRDRVRQYLELIAPSRLNFAQGGKSYA